MTFVQIYHKILFLLDKKDIYFYALYWCPRTCVSKSRFKVVCAETEITLSSVILGEYYVLRDTTGRLPCDVGREASKPVPKEEEVEQLCPHCNPRCNLRQTFLGKDSKKAVRCEIQFTLCQP
jgi:hypothetical protein